MMRMSVLLLPSLLLGAPAWAQAILTVDGGGGGDFTTIGAAIAAAPAGATVLVRAGTYDEGGVFGHVDRSLVVTAERGALVRITISTLEVSGLDAGETVVLRGLTFAPFPITEALVVLPGAGTVWLEDSTIEGSSAPFVSGEAAVRVEGATLIVEGSSITAGAGFMALDRGKSGLLGRNATLHVFDSTIAGGRGGGSMSVASQGGAGVALEGGFLFAASSTLRGGPGGIRPGPLFSCSGFPGGMGGTGLEADDGAEAYLLGGSLLGGPGGLGGLSGPCLVGPAGVPSQLGDATLESVAWPSHGFSVTSPAMESELATATFTGSAGEFAWYLFSDAESVLFAPQVLGTLLLGAPIGIVPAGALSGAGTLGVSITPVLPPGAASQVFYLQALFLETSSNTFTLSSPAALVILAE